MMYIWIYSSICTIVYGALPCGLRGARDSTVTAVPIRFFHAHTDTEKARACSRVRGHKGDLNTIVSTQSGCTDSDVVLPLVRPPLHCDVGCIERQRAAAAATAKRMRLPHYLS